jgi:hypothetical protein
MHELGEVRSWMLADVPLEVGLVETIDREQKDVLRSWCVLRRSRHTGAGHENDCSSGKAADDERALHYLPLGFGLVPAAPILRGVPAGWGRQMVNRR